MSKLTLINMKGDRLGDRELADSLLVLDRGDQAVHDAVVARQAGLRAGSASTKGKGAVRGTGKKPWRQKGTGRARAGYASSPVWRGGGVAHGPHPRDYAKPLPKRQARLAFARAFSARVTAGDVMVLEALELAEAKTRLLAALQKSLKADSGLLVVVDVLTPVLTRAARNLPKLELVTATDVSTYSMLRWPKVAVTQAAMERLAARLQAAGRKGE